MAKQIELELEIGANFSAAIALDTTQAGRTHRADIRETVGNVTVKVALRTSPSAGQGTITLAGDTVTLTAGADITELLSLSADSAFWVVDIESIGATAADVRREARGLVLVTRDITRLSEPTAAANASELLTYSLTDGQTLTTDQKTLVRTKIGAGTGGGSTTIVGITGTKAQFDTAVTDGDFAYVGDAPTAHTHLLAAGATDVSMTAANLNTLDDGLNTALHFHDADRARGNHTGTQLVATISDFSTAVDARVAVGNAATVTTNANLTGHVTSVGNAAVLGSFTLAQLNTAISDADVGTVQISGTPTVGRVGVWTNATTQKGSAITIEPATVGSGDAIRMTAASSSVTMEEYAGGMLFRQRDGISIGYIGQNVRAGISSVSHLGFAPFNNMHICVLAFFQIDALTIGINDWTAATPTTVSGSLSAVNVSVADEAFGASWNAALTVPTKNAVYDKVRTLTSVLFNSFADASTTNVNGTEDDLYSHTIAADTLAINGDSLFQKEHVQFVASATAARRIKKYYGGTLVFDSGALTLTLGGDFIVETTVIRESATVVRVSVSAVTTSASTIPYATYTRITGLALSGATTLKTTGIASGTGAASGDIINKMSKVTLEPAA